MAGSLARSSRVPPSACCVRSARPASRRARAPPRGGTHADTHEYRYCVRVRTHAQFRRRIANGRRPTRGKQSTGSTVLVSVKEGRGGTCHKTSVRSPYSSVSECWGGTILSRSASASRLHLGTSNIAKIGGGMTTSVERLPLPPGAIDVRAVLEANLERDKQEIARLQASLDDERRAGLVSLFLAVCVALTTGVAVQYFHHWQHLSSVSNVFTTTD